MSTMSFSSLTSLSYLDSFVAAPITVPVPAADATLPVANIRFPKNNHSLVKEKAVKFCRGHVKGSLSLIGHVSEPAISLPNVFFTRSSQHEEKSALHFQPKISKRKTKSAIFPSVSKRHSSITEAQCKASLCIGVIGATGHLAKRKIFPALFALYYSGYIPKDVFIFGYSRRDLTDEGLRSIISSTLTCRIDYRQALEGCTFRDLIFCLGDIAAVTALSDLDIEDCSSKMDAFLSQIYHVNGGYDNREGMSKLNYLMEQIEGESDANRIFYLSVPQEALIDVASSIADNAQSQNGWNRIVIEKPFGFEYFNASSSQSLLSMFEEKQLYRIDHLLGRNIVENVTVLRFSNLAFQPLWNRNYVRSVQVIFSEDLVMDRQGRNFDNYGIISDIIHNHILQTIALLAMELPVSLDGEDIRNEKVKVLRSIRKLEPGDVILGQYKCNTEDGVDIFLNSSTPTFFATALYIENARWDGVPFLIKAGTGLMKHRVEIRIQFQHVPGNLYYEHVGHNDDLANNELILRDFPDEAILVRLNNKVPGLGLQLDVSELNLLYKDKYNAEIPDSYEQLLLDVISGDTHLFMRSDEVAAAWNILSSVLQGIDKKDIKPELYELGSQGPVKASNLWAKHAVKRIDD